MQAASVLSNDTQVKPAIVVWMARRREVSMAKTFKIFGTAALFAVSAAGVSLAQATPSQSIPPASTTQAAPSDTTYATGKPLETQSKEGFWGHMNPLARKKWVHRQVDPLKDRVNELDELQAKNANDIRDVDTRATAGINRAMMAANAADAHAADASGRADQANSLAVTANGHVNSLNGTVSNLDQYQSVTATEVRFTAGRTALGPKGKSDLDELASRLANEKGYIVEVQGYSRAGVPASQAMADAVERYLVTAHQVPVYRIYKTGLGKVKPADTASADEKPLTNGVRVTLLHNSLATMGTTTSGSLNQPQSATPASASRSGAGLEQ
jgi:outer membrane protein OmpA-like peptidoglycan-associated protein